MCAVYGACCMVCVTHCSSPVQRLVLLYFLPVGSAGLSLSFSFMYKTSSFPLVHSLILFISSFVSFVRLSAPDFQIKKHRFPLWAKVDRESGGFGFSTANIGYVMMFGEFCC